MFKKLIATTLVLTIFTTFTMSSFASTTNYDQEALRTTNQGIKILNYTKSINDASIVENFDAEINNQTIKYEINKNANTDVVTFVEDGQLNVLTIDHTTGLVNFNGKSTHTDNILEEKLDTSKVSPSLLMSDFNTMNRSNSYYIVDPTSLSYRNGSAINCVVHVDILIGLGLVTGAALFAYLASAIGTASIAGTITARGVTVKAVSNSLSFLCTSGTVLVQDWKIYYQKKQDLSTTSVKLTVTGPTARVVRQSVKFYEDKNYTQSASSWLKACYFQ